jgi:hypothetical protein
MDASSNMIPISVGRRELPGLIADIARLVRSLLAPFDPYRPERHYMRGPGPRWHAKHDPTPPIPYPCCPGSRASDPASD